MVFSCVASRNKRGAARHSKDGWNYPKQSPASTLFELNPAVRRTATTTPPFCEVRAAASGPGIKDAPPQARRPYGSQKLDPFVRFVLGALSVLSLSSLPAVNATSPVELQSAARGGGELRGSKSRKSIAPSTAPCQPHCGSAFAPPCFRAPCAIHSISAHRRND